VLLVDLSVDLLEGSWVDLLEGLLVLLLLAGSLVGSLVFEVLVCYKIFLLVLTVLFEGSLAELLGELFAELLV
jgi:hypothetical protein